MKLFIFQMALLISSPMVSAQPTSYTARLPEGIDKKFSLALNLGVSGQPLSKLPSNISVTPPQAEDAITYPQDPEGIATIKVANSRDYQTQDIKNGVPISEFKTRAEFSTIDQELTHYGEGDSRVYRVAIRLHEGWQWDDSVAIFTQFKRMSAGPDMFLGVKKNNIILRIGRNGEASSSQTIVVPKVKVQQWVEIVLSVHWSTSNAGKVRASYRYSDEESYHQIRDIVGKNLQDPSKNSYIKFGIYKPDNFSSELPVTASQVLDIGNVSILLPTK